jgi:hypothetical protein
LFQARALDVRNNPVVSQSVIIVQQLSWPNFSRAVELGRQNADKKFLAVPRTALIRAHIVLDPRDLIEQPDDPTREPFGVGDAITRNAFAQVFRLADIEHTGINAAKEVDAGPFGKSVEKCSPKRSTNVRGGGNNQS